MGEGSGHPFRGNQWTSSGGGSTGGSSTSGGSTDIDLDSSKVNRLFEDGLSAGVLKDKAVQATAGEMSKLIGKPGYASEKEMASYGQQRNVYPNRYSDPTQNTVDNFNASWAESSSTSRESIAAQRAAIDEFGLEDTNTSRFKDLSTGPSERGNELKSVARTVIRGQYEATQGWLVENNIKEVTLYRGMMEVPIENDGEMEMRLQPLSSFSADPGVALQFAIDGSRGVMIAVKVPADRIVSTPFTGFGSKREKEVVVLGGRYKVIAIRASKDSTESKYTDKLRTFLASKKEVKHA